MDQGAFRAPVRVRPRAHRTAVGGSYGDPPALVVAVTAAAVQGAANAAVIRALAEALDVRRSQVRIVTGATARTKVVEIDAPIGSRWEALLDR